MTPSTLARRGLLSLAVAALATALTPSAVYAAPPLRVILPVSAGSGVDANVRTAQVALSKALGGQPVVIENLPGAGGITGTQALVKAAPDGNTIAVVSNNHAVNPSVFKNLPYDSLGDITPITVIGGSPFVFVVNPKVPAANAKELQALLKSKPDALNIASSGNGTIIQLAGRVVIDALGGKAHDIPYKGMGPMITDLMSGQVEMGASSVVAIQGQLKAGTLRAIGLMGKERLGSLPDVKTFAEQGFPDANMSGWFVAVGPKGMPAAQVQRLHDALVAAFNDPEVKASFAKQENHLVLGTPEQAAQFLKSEQDRYARMVEKAKVAVE
ncbi:MAG: tripartite tricarboxylate transporter substrate-binding protein [Burkholderiaceae bacterium]